MKNITKLSLFILSFVISFPSNLLKAMDDYAPSDDMTSPELLKGFYSKVRKDSKNRILMGLAEVKSDLLKTRLKKNDKIIKSLNKVENDVKKNLQIAKKEDKKFSKTKKHVLKKLGKIEKELIEVKKLKKDCMIIKKIDIIKKDIKEHLN